MPEAVHRRAKLVLLDTIGVTLAGAARPEVIGLRERLLLGAGRGATVRAAGGTVRGRERPSAVAAHPAGGAGHRRAAGPGRARHAGCLRSGLRRGRAAESRLHAARLLASQWAALAA